MNDLLICAKAVGHDINPVMCDGIITIDCNGHWIDYNPRTNDAQAMELLRWYISNQIPDDIDKFYKFLCLQRKSIIYNTLESVLNGNKLDTEKLINAVCAMEDTHE